MHIYDEEFFKTADRTAARSAVRVLPPLAAELEVRSVLDLGCGRGVWLSEWLRLGALEVFGVDGPYVELDYLHIPKTSFLAADLSMPLVLNRSFDLVQSLEVAEHLPESAADQFVDNLTGHGKLILFSAAVPGQGGEYHINEQSWEYWREKFARRGFVPFDFLRPRIKDDTEIFFWYRHGVILYVHEDSTATLPSEIRKTRVSDKDPIPSYLPRWTALSRALIRNLPRPLIDRISRVKNQVVGLVS